MLPNCQKIAAAAEVGSSPSGALSVRPSCRSRIVSGRVGSQLATLSVYFLPPPKADLRLDDDRLSLVWVVITIVVVSGW